MLRDASRSGSSNTAQAGRASYDALESSVPVDDDDDGEELATVSSSYHHRQPAPRRGSVSARDRSLSRTVSSDRGSDLRGWTATRAQHEQAAGGGGEDGDFGEADDNEPPQWFVPKPGHAGALIVKFDSMAVRWVVFGTMALGGASFSSLFFLSAWCDGKREGIGTSRPRTSMLAGAGFTVFWIAIVFFAWHTTCTRLLRWHSDDRTSRAEQLARQLFVSGVGGRFENENQLSAVFEKFGRVVHGSGQSGRSHWEEQELGDGHDGGRGCGRSSDQRGGEPPHADPAGDVFAREGGRKHRSDGSDQEASGEKV